ncbi:Ornithine decarboxylase [Sparassis crispa]|uniref:ornithine decarboxylase n=1 Tax=Sparassis crispa TaxID=139825 RepID=A0A401H6I6_9APHY|nr:Ornithine decarboxylase [Sparassis crispa]GBE90055.1 Ornithine decarboxylase [Sparassis crispa]
MSRLDILAAQSPVDFDFDVVSCSPSSGFARSYSEKLLANAIVNGLLSSVQAHDNAVISRQRESDGPADDDVTVPGLPPLLRGHPDIHLRNGVMHASHLAASGESDAEKAFFVADLSYVFRQHERWDKNLPEIEPFYAIKCNPDPYVLRLLAAVGAGFDCASIGEISRVLELGVDSSRIIFANPCKATSFIRNSAKAGVDMMTFDNTDELYKIARVHPGAKLVVRILTDDSKSLCRLGLKFGAPLVTVPGLLTKARELKLDVIGVSFHVGSGCFDSLAYADAVERARSVFEMGREAGYAFSLLDVGGGFEDVTFEATASILMDAINRYFPDRRGIRIIAEPGRYYVSRAFSLAANVIARRAPPALDASPQDLDVDPEQPSVMYYINDGVYGSFNCILFDHQVPQPYVLSLNGSFHVPASVPLRPCSVWGPTCDSIDCVCPVTQLPDALQVGDWLAFENMGAYTVCAASQFNGFEVSNVIYTTGGGAGAAEVRRILKKALEDC